MVQGHIALDQAVFPENTPGFVLDVLARSSLWKIGLDYRHGNCFPPQKLCSSYIGWLNKRLKLMHSLYLFQVLVTV